MSRTGDCSEFFVLCHYSVPYRFVGLKEDLSFPRPLLNKYIRLAISEWDYICITVFARYCLAIFKRESDMMDCTGVDFY